MNLFRSRRSNSSAQVARQRLDILLVHERRSISHTDLMALLRDDVIALTSRYVDVNPDTVQITVNRGANVFRLAIDIEIPHRTRTSARPNVGEPVL
jgi:cell division topological specificity factor